MMFYLSNDKLLQLSQDLLSETNMTHLTHCYFQSSLDQLNIQFVFCCTLPCRGTMPEEEKHNEASKKEVNRGESATIYSNEGREERKKDKEANTPKTPKTPSAAAMKNQEHHQRQPANPKAS